MFYHDKQGYAKCTVGELKEALSEVPDDYIVSPTVTYDNGVVLSIQSSDKTGNWFVGWADFAKDGLKYRCVSEHLKINVNPAYGPLWSFKPDSLTELQNVNTNYPPESK